MPTNDSTCPVSWKEMRADRRAKGLLRGRQKSSKSIKPPPGGFTPNKSYKVYKFDVDRQQCPGWVEFTDKVGDVALGLVANHIALFDDTADFECDCEFSDCESHDMESDDDEYRCPESCPALHGVDRDTESDDDQDSSCNDSNEPVSPAPHRTDCKCEACSDDDVSLEHIGCDCYRTKYGYTNDECLNYAASYVEDQPNYKYWHISEREHFVSSRKKNPAYKDYDGQSEAYCAKYSADGYAKGHPGYFYDSYMGGADSCDEDCDSCSGCGSDDEELTDSDSDDSSPSHWA